MTSGPPAIRAIYRYPVKGLSPQALEQTELSIGQTVPADRLYAIENGPSGFDPAAPAYFPKQRFLMLMRNERLAGLRTDFDPVSHTLTIDWEGRQAARGDLRSKDGRLAIEACNRGLSPAASCRKSCAGHPKFASAPATVSPMWPKKWSRSSIWRLLRLSRRPQARRSIRCVFAATCMSPAGRPGMNSAFSAMC